MLLMRSCKIDEFASGVLSFGERVIGFLGGDEMLDFLFVENSSSLWQWHLLVMRSLSSFFFFLRLNMFGCIPFQLMWKYLFP